MVCSLLMRLSWEIDARLRRLNPLATSLQQTAAVMERRLVFLAKCAICIFLVLVLLQWRSEHAPNAANRAAMRAAASAVSMVRAGGDALAGAAREKCMSAPRDCLSAAQRLQSATTRAR
jgi:hypothetical protein